MLHHLSHFPHSVNCMIFSRLQHLELVFDYSICISSENKRREGKQKQGSDLEGNRIDSGEA
uniref:Uncharacterized protein n=1 Tax=Lotus japonicus TaxID=34305 RepID=I3T0A8_LOTJA|nr:unknown [Lotus japonicus]